MNLKSDSVSVTAYALSLAAVMMFSAAGCGEPAAEPAGTAGNKAPSQEVHAHPSEGPHHGDLVELGNEEFHVEVVHGDAGKVSAYILDSTAKAAVPVDSPDLTINISHDGHAEQFKLLPEKETADPDGKSSRFSLTDKELAGDLDNHDATAKVVVTIQGKQYTGNIAHAHADDHGHEADHKH